MRMRRAILAGALVVLGVAPVAWADSGLEVRFGAYFPSASSNIFTDADELYGAGQGDWVGFAGGVEFGAELNPHLELGVAVDGYDRELDTSYRDFVRPGGDEIRQSLHLTVVPMSLSLRVLGGSRRGLRPYLLVGGNVYYWEYRAEGDFIDFYSPGLPVSYDYFRSTGTAFGVHVGGGLRVPLSDDVCVTAEGRYNFAGEVDMDDDFYQNRIDVSGAVATIGIRLRF